MLFYVKCVEGVCLPESDERWNESEQRWKWVEAEDERSASCWSRTSAWHSAVFRGILRNVVPRVSSHRSQTLQTHARHALNTSPCAWDDGSHRLPIVAYFRDLNFRLARSVQGVLKWLGTHSNRQPRSCSLRKWVVHCPYAYYIYRGRYLWSSAVEKWTEGRSNYVEKLYLSGATEILGLFRHQ